jgi:O-antigen/teichoic acid export membrane protein
MMYAPTLLLGRLSTTRAVGLFKISSEIANLPTTQLVAPINRAVFPGYAQLSQDGTRLAKAFLDVIQTISLIILPIGIGIASVAELAVPLLLGDQWHDAVSIVKTLAIAGAVSCLLTNAGSVYMSIGRPHLVTVYIGSKAVLLLFAMTYLAPTHGATGVAWAVLLSESALLPVGVLILKQVIGITFWQYIVHISRASIGCAVMYAVVRFIHNFWAVPSSDILVELWHLLVLAATGAATYLIIVLGMWRLAGKPESSEKLVIDWISARLSGQLDAPRN